MAIHMEKDPENGGGSGGNKQRGGRDNQGGGSNPMLKYLIMALPFLLKRPKLFLFVAVIAAGMYFFGGGSDLLNSFSGSNSNPDVSFGCDMDEAIYDEAQVFEPLSAYGNSFPEAVSLLRYAPNRLNQGRQGSCVGWASAYGARSILHSKATGSNPNDLAFSPSFVYNQIALNPECQGSYLRDAMETMLNVGALPMSAFPYDPSTCRTEPTDVQRQQSRQYRIKGYNRLSKGSNKYKVDANAVRQNLAQGAPVMIGMMVGGSFMQLFGKSDWKPGRSDYGMPGYSGHAMCVIGYDDNRNGGSFEIMNSWGNRWGKDGVAWVRYSDFEHFVKEAYGLFPMGDANTAEKLAVRFGFWMNEAEALIPLTGTSSPGVFRTKSPIKSGDRFKIAVENSIDCYTYIFGEEADGKTSVLFPYTDKHSPYCGITGTRLFPRDYSMVPDKVGNRDRIAVVVSKKPLNYNAVKDLMNSSNRGDFKTKLDAAISSERIPNVKFAAAGDFIKFDADLNGKNVVGAVIEFDKK